GGGAAGGALLRLRVALRDRSHALRLPRRAARADHRAGAGAGGGHLRAAGLRRRGAGGHHARGRHLGALRARGERDPGDDRYEPAAPGRRGRRDRLRGSRGADARAGVRARRRPGNRLTMDNVELLRPVYEQWSRGDYSDGSIYAPDVVLLLSPDFPDIGIEPGYEGLLESMRYWIGAWERPFIVHADEFVD